MGKGKKAKKSRQERKVELEDSKKISGEEFNKIYVWNYITMIPKGESIEFAKPQMIPNPKYNPKKDDESKKTVMRECVFIDDRNVHCNVVSIDHDHVMDRYCHVTIPDDAKVLVRDTEFTTDKIVIDENSMKTIWDDDELCDRIIKSNPFCIKHVIDPSYELKKLAVGLSPGALCNITDPDLELCKMAVRKDPLTIIDCPLQDKDMCQGVVDSNPILYMFCKVELPDLNEKLVSFSGMNIKTVKPENQSDELKWIALRENVKSFEHIANPTDDMIDYACDKCPWNLTYVSTLGRDKYALRKNPNLNKRYLTHPELVEPDDPIVGDNPVVSNDLTDPDDTIDDLGTSHRRNKNECCIVC